MILHTFESRGIRYALSILDEPEVERDPTLLLFREDEEDAIVTVHLDPDTECRDHIVADRVAHLVAPPMVDDQ